MGRYRRTSTCRYCYTTGHTQRSCPQMKADADSGDSWARDKVERYQNAATSRKCSYCKEGGHNKASCTTRKQHGVIYHKTLNDFTENLFYRCEAVGIKVGSLIAVTTSQHLARGKVAAIIEQIMIDDRAPDYKWLNTHYKSYSPTQTGEELGYYEAFHQYANSLKTSRSEATMFLRSLTGNGLGYWNDSETGRYEICDVLRDIEQTAVSTFEIVSVA